MGEPQTIHLRTEDWVALIYFVAKYVYIYF